MNGAECIIKCLEEENVEYVFGYPGVAICPFYNAIVDSKINSVLVRTEQSAAHAASGYTRVSGKPGVCAVTSGPGATNLITGIATAFADSIPLVCITGQVVSSLLGSDVFHFFIRHHLPVFRFPKRSLRRCLLDYSQHTICIGR